MSLNFLDVEFAAAEFVVLGFGFGLGFGLVAAAPDHALAPAAATDEAETSDPVLLASAPDIPDSFESDDHVSKTLLQHRLLHCNSFQ